MSAGDSNNIPPVGTHNKQKVPSVKKGFPVSAGDSNNIPPVGTHNKQKSPSVKKGFFCERGGLE